MWRPRSLRVRFTLRALFVFISLFMVWGGYHTNRALKERNAVAILRRRDASIGFVEMRNQRGFVGDITRHYRRLIQFIWRQPNVTSVALVSTLDDDVVNAIRSLPRMSELAISSRRLSSEEQRMFVSGGLLKGQATIPAGALRRVLDRGSTISLSVDLWVLSDDDCSAIAQLKQLRSLAIGGCVLSESGMAELMSLPNLRQLTILNCNVPRNPVAGSSLAERPGSQFLQKVRCHWTPVNSTFAEYLSRCPRLNELSAQHELIGDEFVKCLGAHPSLRNLEVCGGMITPGALTALRDMPVLEIATVRKMLPKGQVRQPSRPPLDADMRRAIEDLRGVKPGLQLL
jgi:hypothetical protein